MQLVWLDGTAPFPPAACALDDPPGLLAAGGDLSLARLRAAYTQGIFPWYSDGQPILWWSPDPRMVLRVEDFHPSHSLRKRLRQIESAQKRGDFSITVRVNCAFPEVMRSCARKGAGDQPGTWITTEMIAAYERWHRAGQAHSIETWIDGQLAGGLYGISLGRMFFGESMFSRSRDASKISLAHLVRFLGRQNAPWIDCQMETAHLASLGARPVARDAFLGHIRRATSLPPIDWARGWLDQQGVIHPDA